LKEVVLVDIFPKLNEIVARVPALRYWLDFRIGHEEEVLGDAE
jgi:hypothetical protein